MFINITILIFFNLNLIFNKNLSLFFNLKIKFTCYISFNNKLINKLKK